MGNPIKYTELFDKPGVDAGFNDLINHYKNLEKTAKKTITEIKSSTKDIIPTSKGAAEAIGQQSTAFRSQKKVVDESQKAIKALTAAQNKLKTAQSNVGIETAKVRDAIARQNRLTKQEITLNRSKEGSMVAISSELALNKQRYRELSAAQRANVNIGGRLLETIKRQDSEIKKLDSTIGNSQRKVGGYADAILEAEKKLRGQETQLKQNIRALKIAATQTGRNTKEQRKIQLELSNTRKKYGQIVAELRQYNRSQERSSQVTQNFTRVLGALGLLGGITLLVRGMREMIGIFSGFEKQMAKVRAISGATDAEFKLLTDDAKRLGKSTEKTATQVGELQLAFARVGLTTPQIIAATEATLDLSTAIDEDLALSAEVAAKTVKGFNLTAEETARVTDVMALAISSSALTLTAFQDSMKSVAPVALAVNSSLESTTAILSTLVDAGLEASTAGTSLRNIFIELEIQGLTWDAAMKKVRDSTDKVKTATELFGKRASSAALIIANNSEKIDTLTTSYENAAGSAKVMADIMRDTLTGDVDIATSAIQGMVIEIGEKLTPILRAIVRGFTFFISNIGAFIKVILIATSAIVSYRLAIKIATLLTTQSTKATVLKTLVEKASAIGQKALKVVLLLTAAAQALLTGNVKRATAAMRVFNTITKLSPLGLLFGLLAAGTAAFFAFKNSTEEATESQDKFNESLQRTKDLLEGIKPEELAGRILTGISLSTLSIKDLQDGLAEFQKQSTELSEENIVTLFKEGETIEELAKRRKTIFENELSNIRLIIDAINQELKRREDELDKSKSLIKIQEKLLEQAKELPEATEKELIVKNRKIKAIQNEIKRLKALGIETGKQKDKEIDLAKIQQRLALLRAKNLEDELKQVKIIEEVKFKIKKDNLEKEESALIKTLEKRQEVLKEAGKQETDEFKKIEEEKLIISRLFQQLQTELLIEHERIRKEKRIAVVLKNEKEINDIALKELELSLINQGKSEDEINEELLAKKIELLEKEIELRKDIGADVLDQELELAKIRLKIEKDLQDDIRELRNFAIDSAIKAIQKKADEALKAANEEIAAVDKQISAQEALAAQGLENSLKFEQEARAEALLAKLEAEKQKQRAEKISAFWNILSNSESVQEAIAKFGIGEAFARTIEALPAFEKGDLTPDKESIIRVSEKGAEFIVQHGPAQEYLPQLRAMNEGTYNPGEYIDNARFMPQVLPVNDMNIQLLTAEMRAVRDEIKNTVPRMESQFDSVTQSIINTYKWANRKKIIHYKLPSL